MDFTTGSDASEVTLYCKFYTCSRFSVHVADTIFFCPDICSTRMYNRSGLILPPDNMFAQFTSTP